MLAGIFRRLTYKEIRATADAYLRQYASKREMIVDVEHVVDCQLKIDIVPVPGLERHFLIDGLYELHRPRIYVDAGECRLKTNRYRFTLAHELGHIALHAEHIRQLKVGPAEYMRLLSELPDSMYARLEREASCFAGLFLLPAFSLRFLLQEAHSQRQGAGPGNGPAAAPSPNEIAEHVSRRARVSKQVVLIRGFYDGHWPRQG